MTIETSSDDFHHIQIPKTTGFALVDQEFFLWKSPRLKRILDKSWNLMDKKSVMEIAHAHVDRGLTDISEYHSQWQFDPSIMTLPEKQDVTEEASKIAYTKESINSRVSELMDYYFNGWWVSTFTTFTNIWINMWNDWLFVLKTMDSLKKKYPNLINISYPMFWFRDDKPERQEILNNSLKYASGIGTLPERDEAENHIWFKSNIERTALKALEEEKPLHIHLDQTNTPSENWSEMAMEVISSIEKIYKNPLLHEYINPNTNQKEPFIWFVHVISPSCYDNDRFNKLAENMKKHNIWLIVCPSAAVSMKQHRNIVAPIHNSIARVVDFLIAGVYVKMWIDNIGDIYLPMTWDPLYEIRLLADSLRIYDENVIANIVAWNRIPEDLREFMMDRYV